MWETGALMNFELGVIVEHVNANKFNELRLILNTETCLIRVMQWLNQDLFRRRANLVSLV